MGYHMLNHSYPRVMISSRVIHNVSRCQGRLCIARRVFSHTARAGDIIKEDSHQSGFRISRVGSTKKTIVRSVVAPQYYPTVPGETVVRGLGDDTKSDPQELRDASQQKTSSTDSSRSSTKSQEDNPSQGINGGNPDWGRLKVLFQRKAYKPSTRQFTITSPDPKRTTKEQVLRLINSRGRMGRVQYYGHFSDFASEEAIVILATPAFAKWLEDDEDFIKGVLESLTYFHVNGKPNYVVAVSAVVDGLAPSPDDIPIAERAGPLEGFSILHGLRSQVLKPHNLWAEELIKDNTENPDKLSHLILSGKSRYENYENSLETTISLPLANTLFVNGKHSTLEISQWTRRYIPEGRGEYKRLQSAPLKHQHIKAFHHESTTIPPIFVPAIPLTLPRPIANGLGNIIRQLSFGPKDTDNRPASSELETQVTRYMEFSKLHSTIGVWALIYRKELVDPNLKATTLEDTERLESTWGNDDKNLRFVGTQIALGAILCRVVSGGGGWGPKQGLLSLDPQVTYREIDSARISYTPHSIEAGQDSTLGNLARRGDHIQFFTINPNKLKEYESSTEEPTSAEISDVNSSVSDDNGAAEKYITREPEKTGLDIREATDLIWSKRTVFGVVPSTIDKMPKSNVTDGLNAPDDAEPFLTFRKGEFGAVSESGIYLHSSHQRRLNATAYEQINTKIDMPYSYLYRDQPGTPVRDTAEYKLKTLLAPKGDLNFKNVSTLAEIARRFKDAYGRHPTREEEAYLLFQERRELFCKKNGYMPFEDEAEKLKQAAEGSVLGVEVVDGQAPAVTKVRVGHTRWPKYTPEPEAEEAGFRVRKVSVGVSELKMRLRYIGGEGEVDGYVAAREGRGRGQGQGQGVNDGYVGGKEAADVL